MEKQVLKEPNLVQMIDARAAKLFDYSRPITKSSNWTAVIGYPRDRATITPQIGARRTNHKGAFCYRYDYYKNNHNHNNYNNNPPGRYLGVSAGFKTPSTGLCGQFENSQFW